MQKLANYFSIILRPSTQTSIEQFEIRKKESDKQKHSISNKEYSDWLFGLNLKLF